MKTIRIDGKKTNLSFSPWALVIYKQEFGLEPLDVVIPPLYNMCTLIEEAIQGKSIDGETLIALSTKLSEAGHINLYGILWCFIKAADEDTPDFEEWMRSLEELPILDVLYQIAPDFIGSMVTKKKVSPLGVQALLSLLVSN